MTLKPVNDIAGFFVPASRVSVQASFFGDRHVGWIQHCVVVRATADRDYVCVFI